MPENPQIKVELLPDGNVTLQGNITVDSAEKKLMIVGLLNAGLAAAMQLRYEDRRIIPAYDRRQNGS